MVYLLTCAILARISCPVATTLVDEIGEQARVVLLSSYRFQNTKMHEPRCRALLTEDGNRRVELVECLQSAERGALLPLQLHRRLSDTPPGSWARRLRNLATFEGTSGASPFRS